MQKPLKRRWYILFFLDYRIFLKKNPLFEICPNCNTLASLERLKEPKKIQRMPRFFGYRVFHCTICKWDGYIFLYRRTNDIKKIIINYIFALFALYILYMLLLYFFDDILTLIYS